MLALRTLGYSFSVPFGENTRYDLIVECDGVIQRVQCKTGWLRKGAIEFPTASSYYHHPNEKPTRRHYRGQVDLFAVYCRETNGVYLIPIGNLPLDSASLRVSPPLNGQRKRIRYAADYEIARVECTRVPVPDPAAHHG